MADLLTWIEALIIVIVVTTIAVNVVRYLSRKFREAQKEGGG